MSDSYRALVETLRGSATEPDDGGEATRRRILHDLARARRPARGRLVLALIAASLLLSTAFALYRATRPDSARLPMQRAAHATPAAKPAPPELANGEAGRDRPLSSALEGERDAGARTMPRRARSAARVAKPAQDAPSPPAPVEAPAAASPSDLARQRALYISAHRLQFKGAPQRALEAWDAYLASGPSGPLLREAQYNRAVILVRLGRREDAERALAPFARGEHDGFRQSEAKQLMRALSASAR